MQGATRHHRAKVYLYRQFSWLGLSNLGIWLPLRAALQMPWTLGIGANQLQKKSIKPIN